MDLVLVRAPDPADLLLAGPGDRVDLMGPADRAVLVAPVIPRLQDLVLADLGDRVEPMDLLGLVVLLLLDPGERVDLMGRVDRAELGPVDLVQTGLVDRVGLTGLGDLASRVVLVTTGPVDLAAPVDRVGPMSLAGRTGLADRVGLEAPADLEAPASPDLTDRAAQVDRHRRRTSNTVSTTGVARSGVAPGTHRTDSARRITARRLRRRNAASGGTMDLLLEVRRLTGTAHRLLAVGTGRHLLAAGTVDGTGRLATSLWRKPISGRSATAASMPYRSSTRFSVDGASGSSATGFRCTDLTARSPD